MCVNSLCISQTRHHSGLPMKFLELDDFADVMSLDDLDEYGEAMLQAHLNVSSRINWGLPQVHAYVTHTVSLSFSFPRLSYFLFLALYLFLFISVTFSRFLSASFYLCHFLSLSICFSLSLSLSLALYLVLFIFITFTRPLYLCLRLSPSLSLSRLVCFTVHLFIYLYPRPFSVSVCLSIYLCLCLPVSLYLFPMLYKLLIFHHLGNNSVHGQYMWHRGLVVGTWLWDQEVVGSSPGCARLTLRPWERYFTCFSSPHSCVKRVLDYRQYPRVTHHL